MQMQRTVAGAATPESTLVASPVVPRRSARRATARRASNRRAAARRRKDDVEGRIIDYLKDRPQSTTGDIAKGQRDHEERRGQVAMAHTPSARVRSEARASDHNVGPTNIAVLDDGPLRGKRLEAAVVEGRPPSTVDVPADDGTTCRYCLAEWVQSGPSAVYTFLYRV